MGGMMGLMGTMRFGPRKDVFTASAGVKINDVPIRIDRLRSVFSSVGQVCILCLRL
jgi:hypothetical protein